MHEEVMPYKKLVVSDATLPFVARGGHIFGKQVEDSDLDIEEGEEVLVVDKRGNVLTTARAVV